MRFTLEINSDNDALTGDLALLELGRIIRNVAVHVEGGSDGARVRDYNGNTVGRFSTNALEIAERDELVAALNEIHARMVVPFEWSASTPESVWNVLLELGYTMPEEQDVDRAVASGDEMQVGRLIKANRPGRMT